MSKKSEFIEYVKHGGKKIMCSPQIGAGAGYDSKLSGKEIVKTTIDDTIAVCERYNIHPSRKSKSRLCIFGRSCGGNGIAYDIRRIYGSLGTPCN